MKKLVLKFGGTSIGSIEMIKKVENIVKKKFNSSGISIFELRIKTCS